MKGYFKPLLEEKLSFSLAENLANVDGVNVSLMDGFFTADPTGEEDTW